MRFSTAPFRTAAVLGLLCALVAAPVTAQEQSLLSAEIRAALDGGGLDAAQQKFNELYPAQQEQYRADYEGLAAIATEYMQAGEYETGQAVADMAVAVVTGQVQGEMATQGMNPAMAEAMGTAETMEPAPDATPAAKEQPAAKYEAGPARSDLDRFAGLYSDPAQPDERKSFWAAVGCDGRLVTGATWGDASPWWMKSVSDLAFEYADSWTQIRMDFQAGSDGAATGMTHDREDILPSPLTRIGPLPPEWAADECIQPPEVCTTC